MNKKTLEKTKPSFKDDFFEDLESWFSSDIACCDNCIEDFMQYWPLANKSNWCEFQKKSISLDNFYAGSKSLQFLYTKDEFELLKLTIPCPRSLSD